MRDWLIGTFGLVESLQTVVLFTIVILLGVLLWGLFRKKRPKDIGWFGSCILGLTGFVTGWLLALPALTVLMLTGLGAGAGLLMAKVSESIATRGEQGQQR